MTTLMSARLLRAAIASAAVALLAACGGGGGGGGGGGTPDLPAGSFTVSTNSVTFAAKRTKAAPPTQTVRLHLQDNRAASVGAAYVAPNTQPDWLGVNMTGASPDYNLNLSILGTHRPSGTYTAVLTVGTADASGNILRTQNIQISFTVTDPISVTSPALTAGFVLGHSTNATSATLTVEAPASEQWNITSNVPWISLSAANGTGTAQVTATLSSDDLSIDTHTGMVTVTNANDSADTASVPATITVAEPTLTLPVGPVIIGGADGLDRNDALLEFRLDTGTNQHPWTAVAVSGAENCLHLPEETGQVAGAARTLVLHPFRDHAQLGANEATVTITATVNGLTISRSVPVVFNKEGDWLRTSAVGVALSSFPSREVVTRSIQVTTTQGTAGREWTAVSNADWLSVTTSGFTGEDLILTADPAGLAPDTQHYAIVSVAPVDGDVIGDEQIRVGFWVGSTDPADADVSGVFPYVAANPVEPLIYAHNGGTAIAVFDAYTGALSDTFNTSVADAGDMTLSADGLHLFVNDDTNRQVVMLDARNGSEVRRFTFAPSSSRGLAYVRTGPTQVVVTGSGHIFEAATGIEHSARVDAGWYGGALRFDVDPLSRYVYTQNMGLSPSTLSKYAVYYTMLGSERIAVSSLGGGSGGSNGQDLCASADGQRVYTANGAPYVFPSFSTNTMQQVQELPAEPYPNNAACGWNGLFFGGAMTIYEATDVWVYRPNGVEVATLEFGGSLFPNTVVLSGDNTRVAGSVEGGALIIRSAPAP